MMKETYEVLSAALGFQKAWEQAKADGTIDYTDVRYFGEPLMKVPAAIMDAEKALDELQNATAEERTELHRQLSEEFQLEDAVVEEKVEAAIKWLLSTGEFVGVLKKKSA